MQNFLNHVLGTTDISYFCAAVFFAFVGAFVSILIHATNRDKNSVRSPFQFSLSFLVSDNFQRILLNILLIIITVRFCEELTGKKLTMFVALSIGFMYDKLLELLRNWCVIDKK